MSTVLITSSLSVYTTVYTFKQSVYSLMANHLSVYINDNGKLSGLEDFIGGAADGFGEFAGLEDFGIAAPA